MQREEHGVPRFSRFAGGLVALDCPVPPEPALAFHRLLIRDEPLEDTILTKTNMCQCST